MCPFPKLFGFIAFVLLNKQHVVAFSIESDLLFLGRCQNPSIYKGFEGYSRKNTQIFFSNCRREARIEKGQCKNKWSANSPLTQH